MRDLIQSSKQILIVLPSNLCFDTAASALGLAHLLAEGRKVQIGFADAIPQEFKMILDFSAYKTIRSLQGREVILSLNRRKGKVKAVRWRESNDKVQFIITPEEGNFEFDDVDLETGGGDIDLVVTVGCESLEAAGDFYSSNPSFFQNIKILNIDINSKNKNYGVVNKIGERQSLSSWIVDLTEEEGLKLTKEAVEALFKGVLWATEGFRQEEALIKTFKKLALSGGEPTDTIAQLFNTLTVAQLRYMGKIISNLEMSEEGIVRVKIKHDEIQDVKLDRIIYPEMNIISRVKDAKVVMILSEYEKGKILARIYSNDFDLNLIQLYSDLTPVGNERRVTLHLDGDLDEVEKKLLSKVEKKKPQEEIATKEEVGKVRTKNKLKEDKGEKKEPLRPADKFPTPLEAPLPVPTMPIQSPQPLPPQSSQMTQLPPIQPLPPAPRF